jgi:hypothetical protein
MGSFIQCHRAQNIPKTSYIPGQKNLKTAPSNSRFGALFSWHHYLLKTFFVKAYTVYDSHMHFCCIFSPFLYILLHNMSKRPPGRPLGMKCARRKGVSLSMKDKITLQITDTEIYDMVVDENSDDDRDKINRFQWERKKFLLTE